MESYQDDAISLQKICMLSLISSKIGFKCITLFFLFHTSQISVKFMMNKCFLKSILVISSLFFPVLTA